MGDVEGLMGRGESVFCGACGARIDAAVRFCTSCGESQAQFIEADEAGGEGDSAAGAATEMLQLDASKPTPAVSPPPAPPIAGQTVADRLSALGPPPRPAKEQRATGIIVAGYIFAVLLPIVGAIIGAMQYERNRHGIWIIVVSIAMVVLSIVVTLVLVAMINSSLSGLTDFD